MRGGGSQDGGSSFRGDGVGISVGNNDIHVVEKVNDRKGRGINHKGDQGIVRCMQKTEMRVGERKGGQRLTLQPADGSGIRPESWSHLTLHPS